MHDKCALLIKEFIVVLTKYGGCQLLDSNFQHFIAECFYIHVIRPNKVETGCKLY